MYEFRATDFVNYSRCRRKFYYRNVRKWEPHTLGREADMGTLIHAGLASYYKLLRAGKFLYNGELSAEIGTAVGEEAISCRMAYPDCAEMVIKATDVVMYYVSRFGTVDSRTRVLSVEEDESFQLLSNVRVNMHWDVAFQELGGLKVVRDHKTKDKMPSDYTWFDLDVQMKVYQVGAWIKFDEPCAVEHNLIRRDVPPGEGHRPLVNEGFDKNGKKYSRLSTASRDPHDYVRQVRFLKPVKALMSYLRELQDMAKEMLAVAGNAERSANYLCGGCPYLEPCILEQDGETLNEGLMTQLYIVKETK